MDETSRRSSQIVDKRDPVGVPLAINIVCVDRMGADFRTIRIDLTAAHCADQHPVSIFARDVTVKPPTAASRVTIRNIRGTDQAEKSV
jgi:hypothetical protein